MSEALKPCPFCGAKAAMGVHGECVFIHCDDLCCEGRARAYKSDAIDAWNARVDASERHADGEYIGHLQARVEELEAALWDMRPADEANGDVAFSAAWLRRKIDVALTPPEQ